MTLNLILYFVALLGCFGAYYFFRQRKPHFYHYHSFWALLPTFLLLGILQDYFYSTEGYGFWQRSFRFWLGIPLLFMHLGLFYTTAAWLKKR